MILFHLLIYDCFIVFPTTKITKNKKKAVTLRFYFQILNVNDQIKSVLNIKLIYL